MTLQASGAIAMSQINAEFGRGNNLNSYRGTGWWTDGGASGSFSAGAINFSDFFSKRVSAPGTPGNDAYTKLLLHLDGAYTDSSSNGLTVAQTVGSPSFVASPVKFGGNCLYLPASSVIRYNHNAAAFGNAFRSDYTVDCWVYPTLATGVRPIFGKDGVWGCYFTAGKIKFEYYGDGGGHYSCVSAGTYAAGTWHHVAVVRSGSTIKVYVNGSQAASLTVTDEVYADTMVKFSIGSYAALVSGYLTGYVDEFRVSNGIARWTGNFTPPSLQYV